MVKCFFCEVRGGEGVSCSGSKVCVCGGGGSVLSRDEGGGGLVYVYVSAGPSQILMPAGWIRFVMCVVVQHGVARLVCVKTIKLCMHTDSSSVPCSFDFSPPDAIDLFPAFGSDEVWMFREPGPKNRPWPGLTGRFARARWQGNLQSECILR